jgi:HK97 family phage prohead protease
MSELLIRSVSELGVDYPRRTIELVVMPYDTETVVDQPYGRMVFESVAPGAFDGIQRRVDRIRVNRDHDIERTIGRTIALHASRKEGLVAELRIARTPLGDETLSLADEGCLDASAAVRPLGDGMEWSRARDRVRLTKLWLEHIAMTPQPAYETANVLAVRNAMEPATPVGARPNLERVRAELLAARYDALSR